MTFAEKTFFTDKRFVEKTIMEQTFVETDYDNIVSMARIFSGCFY
jgi:hypothetical protein